MALALFLVSQIAYKKNFAAILIFYELNGNLMIYFLEEILDSFFVWNRKFIEKRSD